MAETLYATFSDPNRARTAAEELMERGVRSDEVSLLVKDHDNIKNSSNGVDLEDTRPTSPMVGTEFRHAFDPLGNEMRQLSVSRIERGVDVELNPAQDDYPRGEGRGTSPFSSAPGSAPRDYNRDLDKNYNADYKADVERDEERDRAAEISREETLEATPYDDMKDPKASLRFSRGYNAIDPNSPDSVRVDPDAAGYRDTDPEPNPDVDAKEMGKNVAKGAGIGLGVGALAAVATLLIPGFGLIIGGGALAAAAAALAAGVGTGAIAGGVVSLLKDHGVPHESAVRYGQVYDGGGAVLAVTLSRPEMKSAVEEVFRKHGAQEVETHRAYMA
ncbi:MAG: hypothetical protein QOJ65_2296 [Fimbriimonadaceae bacterium]|jgi:hypothetical protein|nr:hypothetical protein [Fimbriimonadaceae bacterium]